MWFEADGIVTENHKDVQNIDRSSYTLINKATYDEALEIRKSVWTKQAKAGKALDPDVLWRKLQADGQDVTRTAVKVCKSILAKFKRNNRGADWIEREEFRIALDARNQLTILNRKRTLIKNEDLVVEDGDGERDQEDPGVNKRQRVQEESELT